MLAAVYGTFVSLRSRRRNKADRCARCGRDLYRSGSYGVFAVQGRLVCEKCSEILRRSTVQALSVAGTLTALAVVSAVVYAIGPGAGSRWWMPFEAFAEYGLLFGGAVWWMKSRNRRLLRRMSEDAHARLEGGAGLLR